MNKPAEYVLPINSLGNYQRAFGREEVFAYQSGLVEVRGIDYGDFNLLLKNDAIQLAKDLLVFYKVPFCNTVSDGK